MKTSIVLACVASVALSTPCLVDAHGYMMLPKAQLASGDPTRYATEIRGTTVMPVPAGGSFSSSPQINVESFTKAFMASSFTSLRDLIEKKSPSTPACGITPSGGAPQDVPDHVEWSAFADSHVGPCEVWCDQKRVFQEDNCAGKYPSRPAKLPINSADCANAKELKFYWLALHSQDWQIYINCAPLKGSGGGGNGGGNSGGNGPVSPAVTPAPVSAKPTTPANSPPTMPTNPRPSTGNNSNNNGAGGNNNNSGETGADADCGDDLPVAGDDDCGDDLPVAGDGDCDDDLPVAGDDDCNEDLPVAGDGKDKDEYGGDSDNIGFDALQRGAKYTPGKAKTN